MGNADWFAPCERKMTDAGLPRVAIDGFRHYVGLLRRGECGMVAGRDIEPPRDLPALDDLAGYRAAGDAALGHAVVLKLNGGLGTSMGLSAAKSLLPVKNGLSFLDLMARQVLHLRRTSGTQLPLVLMNSYRTRADSAAVLGRYPDLDVGLPLDFLQHKVPRLRKDDLQPAEWPADPDLEWCPPGHGDLYPALLTSGVLDALLGAGIRFAFVSNADNLGAVLDSAVLGWMAAERVPFVMEVAERTEADKKGGHLASRDGRLLLREVAQCPPDDQAEFQNVARWRHFNTNNLWLDLEALRDLLAARHGVLGLPLITNEKPIDPNDPGSPRVVQLETAMGAAIATFDGARALRVPRTRFAPVKTTSDLLALWSDAYVLTDDARVVPSPARTVGPLLVDLDAVYFRQVPDLEARFPDGAPSLVGCRRFVVRGDVRFEGGVVATGDVVVDHAGPGARVVPAGTRLG